MSAGLDTGLPAALTACAGAVGLLAGVLALAPLRRRLARVTRRAPQDDERALVRAGGLALAAGALAAGAWTGAPRFPLETWLAARLGLEVSLAPLAALAAALLLGSVDDLLPRGLPAGAKFAGQIGVGLVLIAPLARDAAEPASLALALALLAGAVVAQNALNTFDNADGAAGGLALVALGASLYPWSAALAGFLAFNLPWRGRTRAMLGDAGSHALGVAFLLVPAAWPALALPLFDLARVVRVRRAAGRPIWRGDRAHLAHRLQGLGLSPLGVVAWLLVIAFPSAFLGAVAFAHATPWPALGGLAGTLALFVATLARVARLEACRSLGRPG